MQRHITVVTHQDRSLGGEKKNPEPRCCCCLVAVPPPTVTEMTEATPPAPETDPTAHCFTKIGHYSEKTVKEKHYHEKILLTRIPRLNYCIMSYF